MDYNYPPLNRKDLSDLSKINDKNRQFKKLNTNRNWSLNLYNLDIEGSSPRKFGFFINKEDFTNKNNDIEKSSPKNYYPNINKKSFNLTNDDIEFSKPQCVKNETNRHINPLEPKYNLPNPPIYPITPPKFIRDSMDISDIKGAKPKKIGNDKNLFKEPIEKEVIKDSWPKKPYLRKSKYDVKIIGTDIYDDAYGKYICDEFIKAKPAADDDYPDWLREVIIKNNVDLVLSGVEQEAIRLAKDIDKLGNESNKVVLNKPKLIELSQDKWATYLFHVENNIEAILPQPL